MSRKSNKSTLSLISYYQPNSPIAEQYRLIRNNIHFSSVDQEFQTIVVTSPEASDGKSTTAVNLATVLAQKGNSVILVDTDLRKPTVHYTFKVSNSVGLTNVLKKDISLNRAILPSGVPNLDILPSGPVPPNPAVLLDSNAMEMVMEELKGKYQMVIFDTPPILSVTDAQTMASKCDGVVMVIASGKTQKYRGLQAKELLEKARATIIGVVVNQVQRKGNGSYGYGNYNE